METDAAEAAWEEKTYDRRWLRANTYLFAPLAQEGFQKLGRGAVLVNLRELVLRKHAEEGHPFNYHAQSEEWVQELEFGDEATRMQLRAWMEQYAPGKEFVLVLVKFHHCTVHRVQLPSKEDIDPEIRGAYVDAEADERQARLNCSDFWARQYHLASPHTGEWMYRVSGPVEE